MPSLYAPVRSFDGESRGQTAERNIFLRIFTAQKRVRDTHTHAHRREGGNGNTRGVGVWARIEFMAESVFERAFTILFHLEHARTLFPFHFSSSCTRVRSRVGIYYDCVWYGVYVCVCVVHPKLCVCRAPILCVRQRVLLCFFGWCGSLLRVQKCVEVIHMPYTHIMLLHTCVCGGGNAILCVCVRACACVNVMCGKLVGGG